MITILEHPLISHNLTILRNKNSDLRSFREAALSIGVHLAIKSTELLETETIEVSTKYEKTNSERVLNDVIILPVLRGGLSLLESFRIVYPQSKYGFAGITKDENIYQSEGFFFSIPQINTESFIIIADPVIATGRTTCMVLSRLQLECAERIIICSIIAAPEGIERIRTEYPDAQIITCSLDREIDEKGNVLPGFGNSFGDKFTGII